MKAHRFALSVATALVLCGVEASYAQTWRGPYLAGTIGSGMQPDGDNRIVRFDKTLDGDFSDTITTVAGVNAFSPGFCNGAALSARPGDGCRRDDRASDFAARGGYDWQMGSVVAGAVGEFSRMDQTSSVSAFSTTPAFYTLTRELNWLNGFRGRAGYGSDRYLIYGTGGLAMGRVEHSFATSNAVNTFDVPSGNRTIWGYQTGAGLELHLGGHWSFGAEYLMTRLDDRDEFTVRVQGPAPATNPFILTNPSGTDLRRADRFDVYAFRFTTGYRF